jgi:hypothetical protein
MRASSTARARACRRASPPARGSEERLHESSRPLSHGERELIEMVRGQDASHPFTLVISFSEGHWVIETRSPGLDGAQGDGQTFDEAWESQGPNWA